METIFIEARSSAKLSDNLKKRIVDSLKGKKSIGLTTTVQYIGLIDELTEYLKRNEITVRIERTRKLKYYGQITGCSVIDYRKVDAVLYLGSGLFHPIMLSIKNDAPILIANPETEDVKFLSDRDVEDYKRELTTAKTLVDQARIVGLIVSTKMGQTRLVHALKLKKKLEDEGKKVYILIYDLIDFDSLLNFPKIEAYINTACPGLGINDRDKFNKPVVNIEEYTGEPW
jgi:2-(3-amino-3-carboxypropyl)histidine synthase